MQEFEISEIYSIGDQEYLDKIICEIDEDGLLINPLLIYEIQKDKGAKLIGQENGTFTILKPSALALAKHILEFYGED